MNKIVNGVTTKYLYDGANILYEYDGSNVITNRYTHNLGIDDVLGIETGGKLYFYHKDTLGSIRTITDSTQQTINTYNYDSFGNTTQTGTLVQPYAYTGREWDKETGLYYYRARTYDPVAGRFIQRDPISFAGGNVNLYGYVENNPVNLIDPSGLANIKPNNPYNGCPVGSTCVDPGPLGLPSEDPDFSLPFKALPETRIPPNALPPADWVGDKLKELFPKPDKKPDKKPCFVNYH